MNFYLEMLKKSINRIEADFDFSRIIDHNSSKGTFREQIIKKFLRPFLPGCYGISGGQAFSSDGSLSKQLDIVIYDQLYSYVAPYMEDFIYFPCESVYGNIEIKSNLNMQSFIEAVDNIASLKSLKREKIDTYYSNPMKRLDIKNVNWDIQTTNEYFGIIFAYESVKAETVLSYIQEGVGNGIFDRENLPNLIVLLKERKIICRYLKIRECEYVIQTLKEFSGYCVEECGENTLSEFMIHLLVMLRNIDLRAMDIQDLSKILQDEIFNEPNKHITNIIV